MRRLFKATVTDPAFRKALDKALEEIRVERRVSVPQHEACGMLLETFQTPRAIREALESKLSW